MLPLGSARSGLPRSKTPTVTVSTQASGTPPQLRAQFNEG